MARVLDEILSEVFTKLGDSEKVDKETLGELRKCFDSEDRLTAAKIVEVLSDPGKEQ